MAATVAVVAAVVERMCGGLIQRQHILCTHCCCNDTQPHTSARARFSLTHRTHKFCEGRLRNENGLSMNEPAAKIESDELDENIWK